MQKSQILQLIRNEPDVDKSIILLELKNLNKTAWVHMTQPYQTFSQKYTSLQKLPIWEKAKKLLVKYKVLTNDTNCPLCSRGKNDFVMHHSEYKNSELFTPSLVQFIHNSCHSKTHKKFK